jgi:hypothetical protein
MPDITNPEAVSFCNNRARPAADHLAKMYYVAKQVKAEWDANNLGTLLPVSADLVIDGSAIDGRHPITGNDVQVLMGVLASFIASMEASNNQNLTGVLNVAVNVNP